MCPGNRPNLNTGSRLTPNGWGPAADRPGSAPARRAAELAGASRPPLLHLFAPGTAASAPGGSGGLPADIAALAAPPGCPSYAAGDAGAAAAATGGVETEATRRPGVAAGPDVEPDAQPARRGHRRVRRQVVLADVARANPFTPPAGGMAATRR